MIVKLSHAIAITLLLYCIMGMNNPDSLQTVDLPPDQESLAELELKEFISKRIKTVNLEQ
jgi:broad specificity phosphatase PhoE